MSRTHILAIIQTTCKIQTNILCNLRHYTNKASISPLTKGEKYLYDKLNSKFQPNKLHVEDVSGELIIYSKIKSYMYIFLCSNHVKRRMRINVRNRNFFKSI